MMNNYCQDLSIFASNISCRGVSVAKKKKPKKKIPMPGKDTDAGKYARRLLDEEPHCRLCAKEDLGITGPIAQGAGVKPLREKHGWDLPYAKMEHCNKCKKKTWHDQWTGEIFDKVKGEVNLSKKLKKRIREVLVKDAVFGLPFTPKVCYEHKSPHKRWQTGDQPHNDDMSEDTIKETFQLYPDESWNIKKDRNGCRLCIQHEGKKGRVPVFEEGWPKNIPEKGPHSVEGCKGCFWYDTAEYTKKMSEDEQSNLINKIFEQKMSEIQDSYDDKFIEINKSYESAIFEAEKEYEDDIKKLDLERKKWKVQFLNRSIWTSLVLILPAAALSNYYNHIAPFIAGLLMTLLIHHYKEIGK